MLDDRFRFRHKLFASDALHCGEGGEMKSEWISCKDRLPSKDRISFFDLLEDSLNE